MISTHLIQSKLLRSIVRSNHRSTHCLGLHSTQRIRQRITCFTYHQLKSLPSSFSQLSVLTNDEPQTHQRRNDQEDIRDNGIPLLPASNPDADSQPDQRVCESKQHPLRGL